MPNEGNDVNRVAVFFNKKKKLFQMPVSLEHSTMFLSHLSHWCFVRKANETKPKEKISIQQLDSSVIFRDRRISQCLGLSKTSHSVWG